MLTVSYDFCSSSTDKAPVTQWTFDELTSTTTKQTVGINVADYSGMPYGTYTEKVTFTAELATPAIDLSTLTADYEAQDGDILTGTLSANIKITVAVGAHITLKDLTISGDNTEDYSWAGITPLGDVTITLEGSNNVKGFYANYPGIFISPDCTLTIKGDGSLTATSFEGAGIGGRTSFTDSESASACGNIIIEGGTIEASSDGYGAGIGSGYCGKCGDITILDTVTSVKATKGQMNGEHSIGAGAGGSCGTVTIGGTVYWDGTNYQNDGTSTIGQTSYTYPQN